MKQGVRIFLAGVFFLVGCRTAHNVAVSSYHVVTAPVKLVHRPAAATTPASDVTTPGRPVAVATPHRVMTRTSASSAAPKPTRQTTAKPSATPTARAPQIQFPVAKPVPNKAGYVYSLSDPTKYVDVSGYASGSKVKDPYSGKIFLVP